MLSKLYKNQMTIASLKFHFVHDFEKKYNKMPTRTLFGKNANGHPE
jgi:hypothetical protein